MSSASGLMTRSNSEKTGLDSKEEIPSRILDQAIQWKVRLYSGTAEAETHDACQKWLSQSHLHEAAWEELEAVEREFRVIPESAGWVAHETLERVSRSRKMSRRQSLKILGLGLLAAGSGLLAYNRPWVKQYSYISGVVQRNVVLPDLSQVRMNTGTQMDVVFTPLKRTIKLNRGEIFIKTGQDLYSATGSRSFWVETSHAKFEAVGTSFTVYRSSDETRLYVAEGMVAVHVKKILPVLARENESYVVKSDGTAPVRMHAPPMDPAGWLKGVLIARQMRLADFVVEFNRYGEVLIVCDATASDLKVSGVFQLDIPDSSRKALGVLVNTLPLKIQDVGENQVLIMKK